MQVLGQVVELEPERAVVSVLGQVVEWDWAQAAEWGWEFPAPVLASVLAVDRAVGLVLVMDLE